MSIDIQCPECGAKLKLADDIAKAKRVRCPKCKGIFQPGNVAPVKPVESEPPRDARPKKRTKRAKRAGMPAVLVGVLESAQESQNAVVGVLPDAFSSVGLHRVQEGDFLFGPDR